MHAYILPVHIDQERYPEDLTRPSIYIQYTGNFQCDPLTGSGLLCYYAVSAAVKQTCPLCVAVYMIVYSGGGRGGHTTYNCCMT